jgi:hypothetical protein
MRLPVRHALSALAVGALAALSLPGVRAARAEADLVPPAKQLFAFDAHVPSPRPSPGQSCAVKPALPNSQAGREAALARINEVMAMKAGDEVRVLNGRGFAYPSGRNIHLELLRIHREASAQRSARTR